MSNKVRAGNMLNELLDARSGEPFVARLAVWIAYYPLMRALEPLLDRYERMIHKQYEPPKFVKPPDGFVRATRLE